MTITSTRRATTGLLLATALALTTIAPAHAAPRRVHAELTFDATVTHVQHKKDLCRITFDQVTGHGVTSNDRTFALTDGQGRLQADCTDTVIARGSTLHLTVHVPLRVSTTAGGNPEGIARTNATPTWPAPIAVSTTMSGNPQGVQTTAGGNPQGFRLSTSVATTASGSPQS